MRKKTVKKLLLATVLALTFALTGCGTDTPSGENTVTTESVSESDSETTSNEIDNETANDETVNDETASSEELPKEETAPEVALKDVFAEHNMKVGTCLTVQMITNTKSCELIKSQFNSFTMENAMKPDAILNQRQSVDNGEITVVFNNDMIKMLDWARENDMAVRGHTLVWYSQTPEWIFHEDFNLNKDFVDRDTMLARMESFIRQVFSMLEEQGYSDLFYAYDVVNEAWMENGSMRDNYWKQIIGDDYLWYAFYYANKYAPEHIDLYYNDYNEQYKSGALVKFVNTLVDDDGNYLIDGVGLQAHLYTQDNLTTYLNTVEKLGKTGLKVELTELDVSLGAWQNTLPANDDNLKKQGQYYYNLISGIFEKADAGVITTDALTFWGFSDGLSWRKAASPLLYNSKYEPKYSYYGAAQLKELAGFDN